MKNSKNNDTALTDLEQLYLNRPIEEENLSFKNFVKIQELRNKKTGNEKLNQSLLKSRTEYDDKNLNVGDKVIVFTKVYEKYEEIGGIVQKIYPHKNPNYSLYDISSGTLSFKKLKLSQIYFNTSYKDRGIKRRDTVDLSHIEIPEELKKIATNRLLALYKSSHSTTSWYHEHFNREIFIIHPGGTRKTYPAIVIKAELNNREDIPNKNIKKLARHKNLI